MPGEGAAERYVLTRRGARPGEVRSYFELARVEGGARAVIVGGYGLAIRKEIFAYLLGVDALDGPDAPAARAALKAGWGCPS